MHIKLSLPLTLALAAAMAVPAAAEAPISAGNNLPALGDGVELSPSAERRLGDRIARGLYRDSAYIDDPALGEYVQGIWQRLLAAARARGELLPEMDERYAWVVTLGRERSINAFALPGGYLGVHLGLVAAVSSEDELASVLAHELSHVTQRHIARLLARGEAQSPWLLAAMILGALAASNNPQAAGAMMVGGQAVAAQGQLNFSRDMEREADRVGYGVMTQAGYAPQGFVGMFEKLQQAARLNDTGNFPYLRSHPLTSERIADMQSRQSLLPQRAEPPPVLAHSLLAARARVLSQTGVDDWHAAQVAAQAPVTKPADAVVGKRAPLLYAATLASMQLRDFEAAWRWLGQLQPLVVADAAAARLVRLLGAELALAVNDASRALKLLALPAQGAWARPELLLATQAMVQTGAAAQINAASERLRTWLALHPADAPAWQTLATAWRAQSKLPAALRAEAEARAALLDEAGALDRLRAAQDLLRRTPAADDIEASIIDSRVRQLEARQREQALDR